MPKRVSVILPNGERVGSWREASARLGVKPKSLRKRKQSDYDPETKTWTIRPAVILPNGERVGSWREASARLGVKPENLRKRKQSDYDPETKTWTVGEPSQSKRRLAR